MAVGAESWDLLGVGQAEGEAEVVGQDGTGSSARGVARRWLCEGRTGRSKEERGAERGAGSGRCSRGSGVLVSLPPMGRFIM